MSVQLGSSQAPALQLAPPSTGRLQTTALGIGVVALLGAIVLGFATESSFFQSYLMSFLFWLGLSLGALVMLIVQHLAGGPWGALIARPLEAAVAVIPIMGLLFIPLAIAAPQLFVWTSEAYLAEHATVAAKSAYLNLPFFIVRAVIYFAIWSAFALLYRRSEERRVGEAGRRGRRRALE